MLLIVCVLALIVCVSAATGLGVWTSAGVRVAAILRFGAIAIVARSSGFGQSPSSVGFGDRRLVVVVIVVVVTSASAAPSGFGFARLSI